MIFGWLDAWIFFGAAMAAVLAGGQLVRRTPGANNRLLAALLLSVAVWQGAGSLYSHLAAVRSFALVNSLHLCAVAAYLCTGPLLYLYFTRALHSVVEWRRIHFLHFAPALAATAAYSVWIALKPDRLWTETFHYEGVPMALAYFAAATMVLYGLLVLLVLGRLLRSSRDLPVETNRVAVGLMLGVVAMGAIELYDSSDLLNGLVSVLLVALYWIGNRHPAFLQDLQEAAERERYAQSQLAGLPVEDLIARLEILMRDDELYRDEGLRLRDLADHLAISAHQLSELLNTRFGLNFYAFVNRHRIEHARRLLRERLDLPITAVGFEVGFNSNSVFYEAFRKQTGTSPGGFRKGRPIAEGA